MIEANADCGVVIYAHLHCAVRCDDGRRNRTGFLSEESDASYWPVLPPRRIPRLPPSAPRPPGSQPPRRATFGMEVTFQVRHFFSSLCEVRRTILRRPHRHSGRLEYRELSEPEPHELFSRTRPGCVKSSSAWCPEYCKLSLPWTGRPLPPRYRSQLRFIRTYG